MTDTSLSGAIVAPQDTGTGVPNGSGDYVSAGYHTALAKYKGDGSYVGENTSGQPTLQFANIDTANDQADVGSGYAYIMDSGHSVQSGGGSAYDTVLPIETPYVVILPSAVTLSLDTDAVNDIYLALDPSANDGVYIRHGSSVSAPSDPSLYLGTVDTASGATTRVNDLSEVSHRSLDTESSRITRREEYDHSQNNPHETRSPEASGPPFFKPHPAVVNPILSPSDVDSAESSYTVTDAADPFFHYEGGEFVIPFEIITSSNGTRLAVASSNDALSWGSSSYDGIMTADGSEIASSYPYCFKWGGEWYMVAETAKLYRATNWPLEWTVEEDLTNTLANAGAGIDRTFFRWDGRWWYVAGDSNDNIIWEYSEETDVGPAGLSWSEPSWSPLTTDTGSGTKRESPSCHPIVRNDSVILFYEDESRSQNHMSSWRVSELTPTAHTETETQASPATFAWGDFGSSHHLDPLMEVPGGQPVAVCDVGQPWEIWLLTPAERYQDDSKAVMSSSQTVTAGSGYQTIQFDATKADTIDFLGNFDTANYEYEAPRPGFYDIKVTLGISSWASGNEATALLVGPSGAIDREVEVGEGVDAYINLSEFMWLDAGDTISVQMSASGGDASMLTANRDTKFIVQKR